MWSWSSAGQGWWKKYEFLASLLIFHISLINKMMELFLWLEAVYGLTPLIIALTGDCGPLQFENHISKGKRQLDFNCLILAPIRRQAHKEAETFKYEASGTAFEISRVEEEDVEEEVVGVCDRWNLLKPGCFKSG